METEAHLWSPPHAPHHGEHPFSESALLDTLVHVDDRTNASTSWTITSTGHTLALTFWAARPPLLSYFTADIPGLLPDGPATPLDRLPRLLRTHGDLALLILPINSKDNEYFVYYAGARYSSLVQLPRPYSSFTGALWKWLWRFFFLCLLACFQLKLEAI